MTYEKMYQEMYKLCVDIEDARVKYLELDMSRLEQEEITQAYESVTQLETAAQVHVLQSLADDSLSSRVAACVLVVARWQAALHSPPDSELREIDAFICAGCAGSVEHGRVSPWYNRRPLWHCYGAAPICPVRTCGEILRNNPYADVSWEELSMNAPVAVLSLPTQLPNVVSHPDIHFSGGTVFAHPQIQRCFLMDLHREACAVYVNDEIDPIIVRVIRELEKLESKIGREVEATIKSVYEGVK